VCWSGHREDKHSCITWQFAGPQKQYLGVKVAAGPSNSVVIDRQGMYYVAGKVSFWHRFYR
jgi:hypothetical protein